MNINQTKISPDIFKAYDIRGIVDETLTPDTVRLIGLAIGSEVRAQGLSDILIARDGRLSGPVLSEALKQGLLETGCHVWDLGRVPTPLLYFATNILPIKSGVMLTGSHNPKNYNGLKIIINTETLSEKKIMDLYIRINTDNFYRDSLKTAEYSQQYYENYIIQEYIKMISHNIMLNKKNKKLKIVIDSGNGIAGAVAPQLYRALGCEVIELYCDVDGDFPNHHPDPSVPENLNDLIKAVKKHKADAGFAFDGDGDRLGLVTNTGDIIWPDRQMMLYSKDVLTHYPFGTIVFDVKCSRHLATEITKYNGKPLMSRTGHSLIKHTMQQEGAVLAGEMSGHIFFKDRWFGFDDGMYTGARVADILSHDNQSRSLSEIFQDFPDSYCTPELKLEIQPHQKEILIEALKQAEIFHQHNITLITLDGVRVECEDSWGLMRASNTTPHLVFRFEADAPEALNNIKHLFKQVLIKADPTLNLPF